MSIDIQTTAFSTPGDQFITITFSNEEVISFGFENGTLRFLPDVKTCIRYLFDLAVFHQHGSFPPYQDSSVTLTCHLDKFKIIFNRPECQFSAVWEGENPPAEFLQFKEEFDKLRDRLLKLKAFW